MLWSCVLTGAFGVASAMAPSYSWLLVARAGAGFALSALPICFTLLLEVSPEYLPHSVFIVHLLAKQAISYRLTHISLGADQVRSFIRQQNSSN